MLVPRTTFGSFDLWLVPCLRLKTTHKPGRACNMVDWSTNKIRRWDTSTSAASYHDTRVVLSLLCTMEKHETTTIAAWNCVLICPFACTTLVSKLRTQNSKGASGNWNQSLLEISLGFNYYPGNNHISHKKGKKGKSLSKVTNKWLVETKILLPGSLTVQLPPQIAPSVSSPSCHMMVMV